MCKLVDACLDELEAGYKLLAILVGDYNCLPTDILRLQHMLDGGALHDVAGMRPFVSEPLCTCLAHNAK
eukprot:12742789-Alexandrium_andersonii.AAC.1